MTFWTEERDAKGRKLWARGYSAAWIGAELDTTRCAVIGRAHRARWFRPDGVAITNVPANVAKVRRARQAPQRPPEPPAPPPPPEGIPIEDLTHHTCRWPVFVKLPGKYCGKHAPNGRYCPEHERRATAPGTGRKA